jgi:hypothetical protein
MCIGTDVVGIPYNFTTNTHVHRDRWHALSAFTLIQDKKVAEAHTLVATPAQIFRAHPELLGMY